MEVRNFPQLSRSCPTVAFVFPPCVLVSALCVPCAEVFWADLRQGRREVQGLMLLHPVGRMLPLYVLSLEAIFHLRHASPPCGLALHWAIDPLDASDTQQIPKTIPQDLLLPHMGFLKASLGHPPGGSFHLFTFLPPPPLAHVRPGLSTGWALNRRFEENLGPPFLWSRMEDWVFVERLYRKKGVINVCDGAFCS